MFYDLSLESSSKDEVPEFFVGLIIQGQRSEISTTFQTE